MRKFWEYWNRLQLMPTKDNLPNDAVYLKADKDEGYFVDEGEYEVWYGDGSNRAREWLENLIAIPAKVFFWKNPPKYLRNMYYSYANVSMELNKTPHNPNKKGGLFGNKPRPQYGLRGVSISRKPKIGVMHSRGVWMLAEMIRFCKMGIKIKEVICYGTPCVGGKKFIKELESLGIPITIIVVEGDWVVNRPAYGNHIVPTNLVKLDNKDNLKGIKDIHLSYGMYLKRLDI